MLRWLLPCLIATAAATASAAEPAWVPLPDPYGLGQRLVTIEELHRMRVVVPEGTSDAHVRELYRDAITRAAGPPPSPVVPPALIDGPIDEQARRQDALTRQRRVLKERYGVEAPAEYGETELNALLAKHAQEADERAQEAVAQLAETERRRTAGELVDPTLVVKTDGPSGMSWVMPRLVETFEKRRSPYLACLFGRNRDGSVGPLQVRLVVFLPGPPSGEPKLTLRASDLSMPLADFELTAAPAPEGQFRAEAEIVLKTNSTIAALQRVIDQDDPRVEYRFGNRQFMVPIDDEQRQAVQKMMAAYAAAR